ncbi:tRNA(Ser) Um(44) 2'-O-methyltransferase [Tilletia horrida]|nr:tRNA(Ser) Um(44) 2'-O-methyltransferase [Tilletia horrida]KAK0569232.1 tRNA(Ser) Um(44) 2'-O-methyltransferase [Tilletia horrida]
MASIPAYAGMDSFEHILQELIYHPERNSTTILRAEILDEDPEAANCMRPGESSGASGWTRQRTMMRRLLPRRPALDWPLLQRCEFWRRRRTADYRARNDPQDECEELTLIYTPLFERRSEASESEQGNSLRRKAREYEIPFYHPKVRAIAFRFIRDSRPSPKYGNEEPKIYGTVRVDVCPFRLPDSMLFPDATTNPFPASHRLTRTIAALLQTLHAHTWGHAHDYVKRVQHDILVPRELYLDTYLLLKARHADRITRDLWVEKTDPVKHVFEDIGIAAWLMCLWKQTYSAATIVDEEQTNDPERPWLRWPRPPGGFVDVGCGNGLLVHLLHLEGYGGFGMDLRERKSWNNWRADATAQGADHTTDLREVSLDLPSLVLRTSSDGTTYRNRTEEDFFPPGCFLIGNHADEITPWLPLLATAAVRPALVLSGEEIGPAFANLACCPFRLDGTRVGSKSYDYGGRTGIFQLLFGCSDADPLKHNDDAKRLVQETEEILLLGPNLDAPSTNKTASASGKITSRSKAYLHYLSHVQLQAGWKIEKEVLRIPSTKNWALVGRTRLSAYTKDVSGARPAEAREAEVRNRVQSMAVAASGSWTARVPEGKAACH